jgi:hypothetical protein
MQWYVTSVCRGSLYEKASIEVEGKHFHLDILMGGDMKCLQLVLGLGRSLDVPDNFAF